MTLKPKRRQREKQLRGRGVPERLARLLREEARHTIQPGTALPTVADIARRFRVSVNTVLMALGSLEKEGIVERRHGRGVFVTPRAAERVVGIVSELDWLHPRLSPFVRDVARHLRDRLAARGVRPEMYAGTTVPWETPATLTIPRIEADLRAGRLDALAIVNAPLQEPWLTLLEPGSIPTVHAGRDVRTHDDDAFIEAGVGQLQSRGCRRIAMLAWGDASLARRFRNAAGAKGIETRDTWIRLGEHPWQLAAGWEEFREVWAAAPEKPDGLLIGDDGLFTEASLAIRELGIAVPGQLVVVSHANRDSGIRSPFPAVFLQTDPALVASVLETKLLDQLAGKPRGEPTDVPFEITELGSPHLRNAGKLPLEAQPV